MRLPPPESEVARLQVLDRYQILGTPPEEAFDDIARLAAYVCGTPIALISFIDQDCQWFKSKVGWDVDEIPRNVSLCAHTILQSEVVVVSDTLADEVTKTSPLATHGGLRFYAGVPLLTPERYALGTLCVMDSVPRDLSGEQRQALMRLASQVMSILDLRRISGQKVAPQNDFTGGLESKPAGRALSESDIYRAVTQAASDAIIVIDEQSTILFANRSIERILGYPAEELVGQQLTVLMPDSLQRVRRQAMRESLETGEKHISWQQVVPALHKSGQAVGLEVSFDEFVAGGKRLFTGICRDVTERKRIEDERFQLAAIVESSEDAVIGKNLDGIITTWNTGAKRIYGYRAEEILGKHISILTPPERPDEVPQTMEKLRRGERAALYETVRITKDGRRIHVSLTVSPIRDNAGRITGVSSVDRDITDRKLVEMKLQEQEKALRSSEQLYRSLFEGMVHGIYRLGREGEFLEVNPALVAMLGYNSAGDVLKLNPATELYLDPQEKPRLVQKWLEETKIEDEVKWRRRDGTIITVRLNGRTLTDDRGVVQGFEFIAEDVTERRSLEQELRQVQKVEAVEQLASGIAHEFNNYLGVILGYSEILVEEAGTNQSLRRSVAEIKAATHRAASLSRSLLTFSRKQVLEPTILDLNHAILEAHKMLHRLLPASIEIVPLLDPDLGRVKADPGQIQQILINLVINARDAMPLGGKITIETSNRELDEFYCNQHPGIQPGTHVLLAVRDTGCGMDAETLGHIFEPFFTTKEQGKGTGLGLSTTYGIVKQSGGRIDVESSLGAGSVFRIYLPRARGQVAHSEPAVMRAEKPRAYGTILVVEDEMALRRLIRLSLERCGYKVLTAKDGTEAIEICQRNPSQIHLVLTDIMMPHVNGLQLRERAATLCPEAKFLFMSGYSEEIILPGNLSTHGCAFLEKPFRPDELARKVHDLLTGQAAA
jgi:two-component system, cell cycle sensor histidine kinase and response regulator CckA